MPAANRDATPIPWERLERLLHHVRKPGRYVGGEYNAVRKDWERTPTRVCLAFPDVYDLGMSNFALALLYDALNHQPDVLAERAYLPAPDMIAALREAGLPLYSLESYRPVAAFDLLAISAAYEQLYTNALELLDLAGLPLYSAERTEQHPLVISGGHGTFNPEPIADFFDALVIGEGEAVITEITALLPQLRDLPRAEQLHALLGIAGVYVPRFYRPVYTSTDLLQATEPTVPEAPRRVLKRIMAELPPTPIRQLVPNVEIVHDRAVVEIQRGCSHGCRFCQAGTITRPIRERPFAQIVAEIGAISQATGYEEAALLSLSTADYSEIAPLLRELQSRYAAQHLSFSLPSLRIDAFSVELAEAMAQGRRSGFTFAPEAATDALRRRINKDVTTDALLQIAADVFERGWRTVKLYFMLGLPGETDADIAAIADLAHDVLRIGRTRGGRKVEIHVSVSTFVPKPHTVFQWEPLADEETVQRRQQLLSREIRGRTLRLSWNDYRESLLEALLARGDRRLAPVIARAWELGARFDAWDEWRNFGAWEQAFAEAQLDLSYYLYRRRAEDEVFPWDHLNSGVEKRYLLRDYHISQREEFSADCRLECHGCGIQGYFGAEAQEGWQCPTLR